ncbi:glycosyltransferase, partial [Candidatus Gottesmanbacteria bacterium]|nr:glycosyltransferase [Candidatus Gottesmanbacteria bacterium]
MAIPTYNGAAWIKETLESILAQNFQNFEILICDDGSTDKTLKIIREFRNKKIKIVANKINLGYGKNLQRIKKLATGDVLFLMGQDDILLPEALQKTHDAFLTNKDVGLVLRPYYWFMQDFKKPVRRAGISLFEAAGQLSGLAYLRKYLTTDFQTDTFVAHVYPLAHIAKNH